MDVQFLMDFINKFNKLYDLIRVVDPVKKQIIRYNDLSDEHYSSICYEYWKNGTHCANCVSIRAANEDNTFVKIEYNKDKIYMVTASPVNLGNKQYIVELLKDISETGIVPDLKGKTIEEIDAIIELLNKEVITDELTQVFNRRYINERLPIDLYDAQLNSKQLSVILLDLDLFKLINDTYGHAAGDFILREICDIIKDIVKDRTHWVARYGGEEFLISLLDTEKSVANEIAQEIRKTVEEAKFEFEEHKIRTTISLGCYTVQDEGLSFGELLTRVDQNLYKAKQSGRNMLISN
ncbi:GGDEF domain-containing protein [Hydrogenoanaerobacterium sp.]|uniref:GGDEF domain-containing protein n=1 Tax=Hydrogenoanaerobacterium sp. TaxID=2953763 RepID=UPI0028A1C3CD|nr:GGDEF domain-containing protein [Hydrogenoanaerobacterium sp.]